MPDSMHFNYEPGRFGTGSNAPGAVIQELKGFALASIVARRGQQSALQKATQTSFGIVPALTPRIVAGASLALLWSGPGHWLALAEADAVDIEERLAPLQPYASVFDQGDSRVMLQLSGPRVRQALAKGVSLDLHPRAFGSGDVAVTAASHIGMQIWQLTEAPVYRLLIPRGYFLSFWGWLAASAAEFGAELLPPQRYAAHAAG